MRLTQFSLWLVFTPVFFFSSKGLACSCIDGEPEHAIDYSAYILMARVTDIQDSSEEGYLDVELAPSEVFLGDVDGDLTVQTYWDTAGCGYPFKKHQEYVVYVWFNGEVYLCGDTYAVNSVGTQYHEDTLEYLRRFQRVLLPHSPSLAQEMYVAYYGRPGDRSGLSYWESRTDTSSELNTLLSAFGESEEYTDRFGHFDSTALISNLYRQMFNRDPDPAGLEFYSNRLDSGQGTLATIARQIADGALNDDLLVLHNKTTQADDFSLFVSSSSIPYRQGDIDFVSSALQGIQIDSEFNADEVQSWLSSKGELISAKERLQSLAGVSAEDCGESGLDGFRSFTDQLRAIADCSLSAFEGGEPFYFTINWVGDGSSWSEGRAYDGTQMYRVYSHELLKPVGFSEFDSLLYTTDVCSSFRPKRYYRSPRDMFSCDAWVDYRD